MRFFGEKYNIFIIFAPENRYFLLYMGKIKGMGIALVTPFKADMSVDYDALQHLFYNG